MKIILLQDVKSKGKNGELIEVSNGYARNFLIPKGMAVAATAKNLNEMKQRQASEARQKLVDESGARELAARLREIQVVIKAKSGKAGKLFGSVTSKDIVDALKQQTGIDLDKKKLLLDDGIKSLGELLIKARLYSNVTGEFKLLIEGEE